MVDVSSLVNFSSAALQPGDWTYSIYKRNAPDYLPLNDNTTNYLQASYPRLAASLPNQYKIESSVTVNSLPTLPGGQQWNDIAYGNGVWVAISSNLTHATSTDGITWTARTTLPNVVGNIAYGAGVFVAQGSGTIMLTSPDGITWTSRTGSTATASQNLIYAGGLFVSIGNNGANAGDIQTSPNGITWTRRVPTNTAGTATMSIDRIAYGNGIFVILDRGNPYGYILTSPDGITWTQRNTGSGFSFTDIVYTPSGFFAPIWNSSAYAFSTDGITWTNKSMANILPVDMIAGGGLVLMNTNSSPIYVTADIDIWTKQLAYGVLPWAGNNTPLQFAYNDAGVFIAIPKGSTNALYHKAIRMAAIIGTTTFYLPVISALTNTYTYVKGI